MGMASRSLPLASITAIDLAQHESSKKHVFASPPPLCSSNKCADNSNLHLLRPTTLTAAKGLSASFPETVDLGGSTVLHSQSGGLRIEQYYVQDLHSQGSIMQQRIARKFNLSAPSKKRLATKLGVKRNSKISW